MSFQSILISLRKFKKWQPEYVADKLGLTLEDYIDIESGRINVDDTMVEQLSDLYQLPRYFFNDSHNSQNLRAEVIYSNCTFIGGIGSSNGYINHQYNDRGIDEIIFSKKEEIKRLEGKIAQLQKENARLIELLGERFMASL